VRIAISGAAGRMGQAVLRIARAEGIEVVGAAEAPGSPAIGRDLGEVAGLGPIGVQIGEDVASALLGADVVIDFSRPAALRGLCASAARAGVALVSGTTGIDAAAEKALDDAAAKVPVLWAPNTSIGVVVLAELARQATRLLGAGFDVEIVETHHRAKVDAPSGTAIRLAEAVEEARDGLRRTTGREGQVGARGADEIGVLAIRGGDVIGDHSVHFLGDGERIELVHRATSRDLFARGALRAARAIAGKPARRYTMKDVAGEPGPG
jgi:4-hydroxy-tetrahydrodipicolinate reductase